MGNVVAIDAMLTVLSDPFEGCHMGITAENVARKHSISREAQDALAIESHKRAARAQAEGRFTSQILPIEGRGSVCRFRRSDNEKTQRKARVRSGTAMAQIRLPRESDLWSASARGAARRTADGSQ